MTRFGVATQSNQLRVIVGAAEHEVSRPNCLALREFDLDVRDGRRWAELFLPNSLDTVVAEHLMEHLSPSEVLVATKNIHRYLRPGGFFRCATPDGNHPSAVYRAWVSPTGFDKSHMWVPTCLSLSFTLACAGFKIRPLTYWSTDGCYCTAKWNQHDGHISRTPGTFANWLLTTWIGCDPEYTSLILDAIKAQY